MHLHMAASRIITAMFVVWALSLAGVNVALAAGQTFYIGPNNGSWSTPSNWDADLEPGSGDDVIVGQFVPNRTGDVNVTFDADYNSASKLHSLLLDSTGTTGQVIMNQMSSGTSLAVSGTEMIGNNANGATYNQSAGLNQPEDFGVAGTYNLSGSGTLNAGFTLSVGTALSFFSTHFVGTFNQSGGTATTSNFYVTTPLGALLGMVSTYNLSGGSLSCAGETVGSSNALPAIFNQTGGMNSVNTNFTVFSGATYNLSGGTFATSGNPGASNSGAFNIGNSPTFSGVFTNNNGGVMQTNAANISFTSTFTNNGTYQSMSHSTQTFTTLTIGSTGYLQGGSGDIFNISRNLTNNSTQNTAFSLSAAQMILTGSGVTHRIAWPGADHGATAEGYQNNFPIGVFELASGAFLELLNGNGTSSGALYTGEFLLDGGTAQVASISVAQGMNIYYNASNPANAYLNGETFSLNGGGVLAPLQAILKIVSITHLSNGHVVLQCLGMPSTANTVQVSPDLVMPFTMLASVSADATGAFTSRTPMPAASQSVSTASLILRSIFRQASARRSSSISAEYH